MMNLFNFFTLLIFVTACIGSVFYLLRTLKKNRQLISLLGLFCMAMGIFLLLLVSDSGFAGRWVLTVYLFISTGMVITIYLLVRNQFTKFNKKTDDNL
jgi:hypothetical membrane protein